MSLLNRDISTFLVPVLIQETSWAKAIWAPNFLSIILIFAIVSLAAEISGWSDPLFPFESYHSAISWTPSKSSLKSSIRYVRSTDTFIKYLPWMAAVTAEYYPFTTLKLHGSTKVAWHMTWSLDNPKAFITKKVHCLIERSKCLPWTLQFFPYFCLIMRVEKPAIPLAILINEVTRRAVFSGTWSKVCCCLRKWIAYGTTMVPVGMAMWISQFLHLGKVAELGDAYLNTTASTLSGSVPPWTSCSTIDSLGLTAFVLSIINSFTQGL